MLFMLCWKQHNGPLFPSIIWGQTADAFDCIAEEIMLQDLSIGDWLVWQNMGAYTIATATNFNGYSPTCVFPIIRKRAL